MSYWIALIALLVASLGAPPQTLDKKKVSALAERFFAARPKTRFDAWDAQKREALLAEADALGLPEGGFASALETIWAAAKKKPPQFKDDTFESPFGKAWWLTEKGKGKLRGLLIGLHGGGEGAGDAHECLIYKQPDCVGVFPQGIRLVHDTWNTVHGERFVLTLIDHARLAFDIDDDRVTVTGFSMGGTGSWFFAGRYPDLFAAAAPGPGVFMAEPKSQVWTKQEVVALQHGFLPNVRDLPVHFYVGTKDDHTMPGTYMFGWDLLQQWKKDDPGGYAGVEFTLYEGLPHAFPKGEPKASLEFLDAARRGPLPNKIVWEYASDPYPLPEPGDPQGRLVQTDYYWLRCIAPQDRMRIVATRDGNRFELKLKGIDAASLRVLLRPGMIDPAQDVIVVVDGKETFRGKPGPSLGTLLDTLDVRLDRGLTFDREVAAD